MIQTNHFYLEYVTQKEMCVILGVCKSTGYAIQKRGIIPFEYENTPQGRRQQIKLADILAYQNRQEQWDKSKNTFEYALLQYYTERLQVYPSVLTVSDIMRFTGYAKTTINNWIVQGTLYALQYNNKKIKSLVYGRGSVIKCFAEFTFSTYYWNIKRKSKIHREQEQEYLPLFMDLQRQGGAAND